MLLIVALSIGLAAAMSITCWILLDKIEAKNKKIQRLEDSYYELVEDFAAVAKQLPLEYIELNRIVLEVNETVAGKALILRVVDPNLSINDR